MSTPPALRVYRHETLPPLANALATVLDNTVYVDPLAGVTVAVPSFAVARWLTEQLATQQPGPHAHVANLTTCFPAALIDDVVSGVLHDDATGAYRPERLTFTILHVLRQNVDTDPVYATIGAQLAASGSRSGVTFAAHSADLFDRYIRHRPELLDRWAAGQDVDVNGQPLGTHLLWQPALWRSVVSHIAELPPHLRLAHATAQLKNDTTHADLAANYQVFGVHGLQTAELRLLDALAEHRPVNLFLLTASRTFAPTSNPQPQSLSLDVFTTDAKAQHRQVVSANLHTTVIDLDSPLGHSGASAATALGTVQNQLTTDTPKPLAPMRYRITPDDTSITVHACHGIVREIDAVKDQLLALLDADDTLEPNDIAILTPDVATVAPLIAGVLADGDLPHDTSRNLPRLPFAIRDRSVAKTSPLADTIVQLFNVAQSRITVNEITDLLTGDVFCEQVGLPHDDIVGVMQMLRHAGVTFGIDAAHRQQVGSTDDHAGSFASGFDRIVLGMAMDNPGDTVLFDVAPYPHLDTDTTHAFLTVFTFLTDLFTRIRQWREPRSITEWIGLTAELIDTTLAPPTHNYDRQADTDTIARIVGELADTTGAHSDLAITLTEYGELFASACQKRGVAGVNDSGITVSSLLGVRSIPFRVVCLVGMNDDTLAKATSEVVHDLIATQRNDNDTTSRDETRQLVYDALINTADHLIITHTAFDPRSGDAQPHARILDDLYDLFDMYLTGSDRESARERLTVTHPRQLTHPAYYMPGSPLLRTDRVACAAARAVHAPSLHDTNDAARFVSVAPASEDALLLSTLIRALTDPSQAYLRRHGITIAADEDTAEDRDTFLLGGLGAYTVYDQLLHWPNDTTLDRVVDALPYRGVLPTGSFGALALDDVRRFVTDVKNVRAGIAATRTVTGVTVSAADTTLRADIATYGDTVVHVTASSNPVTSMLHAWVELVALTAHGHTADAVIAYRKDTTLQQIRITPPERDAAQRILTELTGLYRHIVASPTVLFPRTSHAYASRLHQGDDRSAAAKAAENEWDAYGGFGENTKNAVRYLYGYDVPFRQILKKPTFHTIATQLFTPLLDASEAVKA